MEEEYWAVLQELDDLKSDLRKLVERMERVEVELRKQKNIVMADIVLDWTREARKLLDGGE